MHDFIAEFQYYGLTARLKRLSDFLNGEARKIGVRHRTQLALNHFIA